MQARSHAPDISITGTICLFVQQTKPFSVENVRVCHAGLHAGTRTLLCNNRSPLPLLTAVVVSLVFSFAWLKMPKSSREGKRRRKAKK